MAGTANISASLNSTINGALSPISVSGSYSMTGSNAPILFQTLSTTPAALAMGNASNIGLLLLKVLTGTGSQVVVVSLDSGATQVVSSIKEGLGILLANPPNTLYASVNSGTIQVQYQIAEE